MCKDIDCRMMCAAREVGQTRCPSLRVYGYLEYNSAGRVNELDLHTGILLDARTVILSGKIFRRQNKI